MHERERYELHLHGQLQQCFQGGDDDAFSRWLEAHTAFAFVGQSGRISALKEARPGGAGYWYAYRAQNRHTRKRYLGPSAKVTLARLEQEALELSLSPVDARLGCCRKWEDHAALRMAGSFASGTSTRGDEAERRTEGIRTGFCLALP